ncbi:Mariner Mos1 transposase [Anthophora retusa]
MKEFKWEVLQHPPYSPHLAPSDFHLFRSLQNNLNGKNFGSVEAIKNYLQTFFAEKPRSFYEKGIYELVKRWQTVVENGGDYIID